jgi:stage II sporulation protein AA (anti-sigma F factor antagonist)
MLKVQMAIKKNRLVIRLNGELDQSNVMMVKKKTVETMNRYGAIHLVFNMENLNFMDSSGIGFIIGRYTELKRKGGDIVICAMNDTIMRIFNISGLRRICKVSPNEEYADFLLGVAV